MRQHVLDRDAIVGLADRPRKAGAGGRDRLETEMLERPRAAGIPGIWQHEAPGLMHLTERGPLVGDRDRHGFSPLLFSPNVLSAKIAVRGARRQCAPRLRYDL